MLNKYSSNLYVEMISSILASKIKDILVIVIISVDEK